MKTLTHKGFEGSAEVDTDLQICRGKLLFIPDLITYEAESPKELQREFEAAVDDYLETCKELGREPHKPFRGSFNVRVPPELHRAAALHALHDDVSLNDVVVSALDCYVHTKTHVHHTVKFELSTIQSAASPEPAQWKHVEVSVPQHVN